LGSTVKGFKEFLMRGNILELGIAVVMGLAFVTLVGTVTRALIEPLIALFLGGGNRGGTLEVNGQFFNFGAVITALITFAITAAVVYFFIVVPMNRLKERRAKGEPVAEPELTTEERLLAEIRDLLATR
jgi:large conductance mechanosensitive channel